MEENLTTQQELELDFLITSFMLTRKLSYEEAHEMALKELREEWEE